MTIDQFSMSLVGFMPESLEAGILYVSYEFSVAIHMCACGCGEKVVTPIAGPESWHFDASGPTLSPSIGNWQIHCRSHYFIVDGKVRWA